MEGSEQLLLELLWLWLHLLYSCQKKTFGKKWVERRGPSASSDAGPAATHNQYLCHSHHLRIPEVLHLLREVVYGTVPFPRLKPVDCAVEWGGGVDQAWEGGEDKLKQRPERACRAHT